MVPDSQVILGFNLKKLIDAVEESSNSIRSTAKEEIAESNC
jgi:hypothetical protein